MKEQILAHHGILGQKWGIRRFQNPDGTLTDAGKARYFDDGRKKTRFNMSNKELEESNKRLAQEQQQYKMSGEEAKDKLKRKVMGIVIKAGLKSISSVKKEDNKSSSEFVNKAINDFGSSIVDAWLNAKDK